MKCEGKQLELGTSILNKDPRPRKTNISIMCVLPFVNLSSESLHICIPFKIPTEVRKFKRNHGEELSKEERLCCLSSFERGKWSARVYELGLQS